MIAQVRRAMTGSGKRPAAPPLEMSRASLTQAWGSGLGKQYEISLSEYLERCEAGLEYWNGRQIVIKKIAG